MATFILIIQVQLSLFFKLLSGLTHNEQQLLPIFLLSLPDDKSKIHYFIPNTVMSVLTCLFLFQERNDNCNSNTIMLSDAKECFTWIWCFEQDWSCSHGSSSFSSKFRSWSRGCDCPCWSGHGHVFRSTPGCMINIAITNLFAIFYFKCLCLCLRSFHSPIKVPSSTSTIF